MVALWPNRLSTRTGLGILLFLYSMRKIYSPQCLLKTLCLESGSTLGLRFILIPGLYAMNQHGKTEKRPCENQPDAAVLDVLE